LGQASPPSFKDRGTGKNGEAWDEQQEDPTTILSSHLEIPRSPAWGKPFCSLRQHQQGLNGSPAASDKLR